VTRPGIDTTMPLWLDQLLRVSLTVLLADATYRWVESPVRRYGLRATVSTVLAELRSQWRRLPPRGGVVGPVVVAAVLCVGVFVIVIGPAAPKSVAALGSSPGGRHLTLSVSNRAVPDWRSQPGGAAGKRAAGKRAEGVVPLPKLSGFGDSVLLGARHALSQVFPGGAIDAVRGRQPDPILDDVQAAAHQGTLEPFVVLHLGNNGLINPSDLQHTLQLLSGERLVLVLNDHLDPYDHTWQKPNNATIARIVPQFSNARILDWNAIAGAHRNWLYPDDLHLTPSGAVAYAKLLAATYRADVPSH
jgi:hypothetical protein